MKTVNVSSDKLFFTSDLHFNHKNIISFCNRPCSTVEEMHELIIKNWNKVVPMDGVVYILGDVSWKGASNTKGLLDQLNGKKILIIGNHDPASIINLFEESYDVLALNVTDEDDTYHVHLSHFPLVEWNRSQKGSIHLHGHCHGSMDEMDKSNYQRMDVGLDSHNMVPLSWENVKEIFNKRYLSRNE